MGIYLSKFLNLILYIHEDNEIEIIYHYIQAVISLISCLSIYIIIIQLYRGKLIGERKSSKSSGIG